MRAEVWPDSDGKKRTAPGRTGRLPPDPAVWCGRAQDGQDDAHRDFSARAASRAAAASESLRARPRCEPENIPSEETIRDSIGARKNVERVSKSAASAPSADRRRSASEP